MNEQINEWREEALSTDRKSTNKNIEGMMVLENPLLHHGNN